MRDCLLAIKKRIRYKETTVAVVGLGYVGLPLAIEFARNGFSVLGIDVDKDRIKRLSRSESYITDVSSRELKSVLQKGKLTAENNFSRLNSCDAIIICVPTPLKLKSQPDISFIISVVKEIKKYLRSGQLVVLESTTYPGTTQDVILPILESKTLKCGRDFYLAFSPERIDPGNSRYPLRKIPKVIGGVTPESAEIAASLYKNIIDKVVVVGSATTAETVKLIENTFRIVNIGLADEMSMLCHKMGLDIWQIIEAASTKPFGFMPFYPGPGVGGHCIPKDPLYLYWRAKKFGFSSRFIKLASEVINTMPGYVVSRLRQLLGNSGKDIKEARILICGVTYKKDIKDLRKSPALEIIDILQDHKARVAYYDPLIPYLKLGRINLKSLELTAENIRKFAGVVIVTDHTSVDYRCILKHARLIFDTRNVYRNIQSSKVVKL